MPTKIIIFREAFNFGALIEKSGSLFPAIGSRGGLEEKDIISSFIKKKVN
jgi:hypothetical protein